MNGNAKNRTSQFCSCTVDQRGHLLLMFQKLILLDCSKHSNMV